MVPHNVLLLYNFSHHRRLVERLAYEMKSYDIIIDSLGMIDFHYTKNGKIQWPAHVRLLLFILNKIKQGVVKKILVKIFLQRMLQRIAKAGYDFVDFHSFYPISYTFSRFCYVNKIPYSICFWGSDFLRASLSNRELMKEHILNANSVRSSKAVLSEIKSYYGDIFSDKLMYADFGNEGFDLIDNITENDKKEFKEKFSIKTNRFVVTCAYNGVEKQNHLQIIKSLSELPESIKEQIIAVFPMTYACNDSYRKIISDEVSKIGIDYIVLKDYMDHKTACVLAAITEIVINIQDTDAFSLTLQDHLYCGNVLIIGSWLHYPELEESSVYTVKTEMNEISSNLKLVIENLAEYKRKCSSNKSKMHNITSWKAQNSLWYNSYKYNSK